VRSKQKRDPIRREKEMKKAPAKKKKATKKK
jgi:hypothetical protein